MCKFALPQVIPRQVVVYLGFYQVRKGLKRLVAVGGALGVNSGIIAFPPAYRCHTLTNGGALQDSIEATGVVQCPLNAVGNT